MNTDCVNCKHARLWTDKEQFEYIEGMFNSIGRMPCRADHYICDKIPKGTEWTEDGNTYSYDGYSLEGENYDDVFHCFEPRESDHKCHTCKHYTRGEHDGSCGSYICKEYSNWESEE